MLKARTSLLIVAILATAGAGAAPPRPQGEGGGSPPSWAYPMNPPEDRPLPNDDGSAHHVPNSEKALTRAQILDAFDIADWHPDGHPPMPEIVERGNKPGVRGCGYCHLPNGQGRPENASLAGLPAEYIERQVMEIKTGARRSSAPQMIPPQMMVTLSENASEDEVKIAAAYFASLRPRSWIRVVETDTVPKTRISGSIHVPIEGGGTEPIGQRIIETPENWERTELRDDASGFLAYVPVGSLERGAVLVASGDAGKTIRCGICHGRELRGLALIPRLAGRSPSYLFRQLYDFQHGSRHGEWSALMKAPVAHLSEDDMIAIAAYLASLEP